MIDERVLLTLRCRNAVRCVSRRFGGQEETFGALRSREAWALARAAGWRKYGDDVVCPACDLPRRGRVGRRPLAG